MSRILVLGGARSGKSTHAEASLAGQSDVTYVATSGRRDDAEWDARVAAHRARRPATWTTRETLDVAGVLAESGGPVLVDCLTLWLTGAMDAAGAWDARDGWAEALAAETEALLAALRDTTRHVVLVSNEVGQGVVPATASGRLFRDEMGVLNARVAGVCDEVWFVTAGLPRRLA